MSIIIILINIFIDSVSHSHLSWAPDQISLGGSFFDWGLLDEQDGIAPFDEHHLLDDPIGIAPLDDHYKSHEHFDWDLLADVSYDESFELILI